jgi:transposase
MAAKPLRPSARLTKAQAQILALRKKGVGCREVAAKFDVSTVTLLIWTKKTLGESWGGRPVGKAAKKVAAPAKKVVKAKGKKK